MKNSLRNPLVSVIIVNYNGKAHLETCLSSLARQTYPSVEIILVDNGSNDGSVLYVEKKFPKVKIVRLEKNTGFVGGNNIGVRKSRGEFIMLLNNDTKVTPGFITEAVRVFRDDASVGVVQSKLLVMDDPSRLDSVGAFQTPTGFLYHYGYAKMDSPKYSRQIDIYSAKGACMAIRRKAFMDTRVEGHMFDPRYFAYFEETDLCHRIWMAGYRIQFVPDSVVYHKMGATRLHMDNAIVQYHSFKNRLHSYIKNLSPASLIALLPLHVLICLLYIVFISLRGQVSVSWAILRALAWNVRVLPETLRIRLFIQQRIRKIPDKDMFRIVMKHPPLRYYFLMTTSLSDFDDIPV